MNKYSKTTFQIKLNKSLGHNYEYSDKNNETRERTCLNKILRAEPLNDSLDEIFGTDFAKDLKLKNPNFSPINIVATKNTSGDFDDYNEYDMFSFEKDDESSLKEESEEEFHDASKKN